MTEAEARRLDTLIPETRTAYIHLVDMCRARGLRLFLGSCLRTPKEQLNVLATGRSSQPTSWHMIGRACDVYPVVGDEPDLAGKNIALFRQMHEEAKLIGWRGIAFNPDGTKRYIKTNKGRIWDGGHLEWPGNHATLAEAIRAEGAQFGIG